MHGPETDSKHVLKSSSTRRTQRLGSSDRQTQIFRTWKSRCSGTRVTAASSCCSFSGHEVFAEESPLDACHFGPCNWLHSLQNRWTQCNMTGTNAWPGNWLKARSKVIIHKTYPAFGIFWPANSNIPYMKIKMFRYTGHCSKLLLQFLRTWSFCRRICSGRLSLWTLGLDMELVARSPPFMRQQSNAAKACPEAWCQIIFHFIGSSYLSMFAPFWGALQAQRDVQATPTCANELQQTRG